MKENYPKIPAISMDIKHFLSMSLSSFFSGEGFLFSWWLEIQVGGKTERLPSLMLPLYAGS